MNDTVFSFNSILGNIVFSKFELENDFAKVYDFCSDNRDYFKMMGDNIITKEVVADIFADLPPDMSISNKIFGGIFIDGKLTALLDIVKGFPSQDSLVIGLLLINSSERGKGLGKILVDAVSEHYKKEFSVLRIGVVGGNELGKKFWTKLGFTTIKTRDDYIVNEKRHFVHIMTKDINV